MNLAGVVDQIFTKRPRTTEDVPPNRKWSLPIALEKAEFLLQHAADTGVTISLPTAKTISAARNACDNHSVSSDLEAEFWVAFTTLATAVKLGSLEGIGSQAYASARRTRIRYNILGTVLVVLVILISAITIAGKSFISDIDTIIDRICKEQTNLDCEHFKLKNNDVKDSGFSERAVGNATYQIWEEVWWLDIFMGLQSKKDILDIYYTGVGYNGQFFKSIWESKVVEAKFKTFYETVISGILTIIYTILGAVAFGVRDLRKRTQDRTWTEASEIGAEAYDFASGEINML
jgi:hypothetical protein